MHLTRPLISTLLKRNIPHCLAIWLSLPSGDFFVNFHTPYILVVKYVRLGLIITLVNVIVLC